MVDVLKYIHENICEPLSVAETAEKFGYSKWYFCNLFKRYTGRTFVNYVRHYRIQLAAIDIYAGEKVLDVALNYGYETVGGFNKAFFTEFGCYPMEYRKRMKECQFYHERRRCTMFQLSDRCSMLRYCANRQAIDLLSQDFVMTCEPEDHFTKKGIEAEAEWAA